MRNAFDVLVSGAKSATKTPGGVKGGYITCPLCHRTVPSTFADAHVSVCLASPRPQACPQSRCSHASTVQTSDTHHKSQQQVPTLQHQGTPTPVLTPQATQQQDSDIPVRNQSQHENISAALLPAKLQSQAAQGANALAVKSAWSPTRNAAAPPVVEDLTGCDDEDDENSSKTALPTPHPHGLPHDLSTLSVPLPKPSSTSTTAARGGFPDGQHTNKRPPSAAIQSSAPATQVQGTQPDRSAPKGSQLSGPSAFDIMRQSQLRAASRCQSFFLERTSDGCWLGHCWAKGCSTPAQQRLAATSCWSVTVTVRPGGQGGGGGGEGASSKETVCLMTNVPPGEGGTVSWSSAGLLSNTLPPEGRWRGGQSALKSALQKAVRLGRGSCAVRGALHLLKEEGGVSQLLRRLSIVCVEDAILHPGLPLAVWLMAAQAKGYALGLSHVEALLRMVYQLAMVSVRDGLADPWDSDVTAAFGPAAVQQGPATLQQVDELGLPPAEACLVKCLLLRSCYGGMGGDVRMLKGFAAYWAARFKDAAAAPPASPLPAPPDASVHQPAPPSHGPTQQPNFTGPADAALPRAAPTEAAAAVVGPQTELGEGNDVELRAVPTFLSGRGFLSLSLCVAAGGAGGAHGAAHGMTPGGLVAMTMRDLPPEARTPPAGDATAVRREAGSRDISGNANADADGNRSSLLSSLPSSLPSSLLEGSDQRVGAWLHGGAQHTAATHTPQQHIGSSRNAVDFSCYSMSRAPEAYFASRLQAEDAPPSYTAFRTASQLLAEALSEQASLQRAVQQAAKSREERPSEQPWTGHHLHLPQSLTQMCGAFTSVSTSSPGNGWATAAQPTAQRVSLPVQALQQPQQTQQPHPPSGHDTSNKGCEILLPKWHAHVDGDVRRSKWLSYLCDIYSQVSVPLALAHVGFVGPMRRADVPLSAVDFHVSDVVTQLLERPEVHALAMAVAGPAAAPDDAEDALKSAMWLFRSSKNPKVWVHSLSPCCQAAGEGGCPEHHSMVAQLAQEADRRQQLTALWTAAGPWADRFSVSYIGRRFGPP